MAENDTNVFEEALDLIADPNIAFLLLSLGGLALLSEIFHQSGFGVVVGVICLALAYFSLGALPTNWAGVGLIFFGIILLVTEVFVTGFGILGVGGVVALVFGGLILTGGSETGMQVSRWLVFTLSAIIAVFILVFAGSIMKLRRMPAASGRESLVGAKGFARSRLDPRGVVWVGGERWEATAEDPPIEEDAPIIVTETSGLRLLVKRDPASIKLLPVAAGPAPTTEAAPRTRRRRNARETDGQS